MLVMMAVMLSEVTTPVSAVIDIGPDNRTLESSNENNVNPPGFTAGSQVYMEVAQGGGGSLDAPKSKVLIYVPVGGGGDKNVGVRLIGADHCVDGSGRPGIDSSNRVDTRSWDTTFTITSSRQVITHQNQVRDGDSMNWDDGCNTAHADFSIAVGDGDRPSVSSGLNGFYRVTVQAEILNGSGTNAFKVQSLNGGYVSFTSTTDDVKFALQQREGRGADTIKSNFNIYFATPCDSAAIETKQLEWFDADQLGFTQNPSNYGFNLWQRARGSSSGWTPVIWNYTNLGGNNVTNGPGDGWWDFRRDQEYRWEWYGVSANNGIQFRAPFDSVYAAISCEGGDFNLTPNISLSSSYITSGMANIGVSSNVYNSGTTASFSNEEWRITRYTVNPSSGQVQVWNGNHTFPANSVTNLTSGWLDGIDQNLAAGTRVCYVLSVEKGSSADPTWKNSTPACATVVYTPFAYIYGNDLRVGSQFMTSTPNRPAGVQGYVTTQGGSWVEYGITAPNAVNGFASQSGARVGVTPDPSNSLSWSGLTFANTGLSGCAYIQKGCFSNPDVLGTIPRVENVLTAATAGVTRTNLTGPVSASAITPSICGTVSGSRIIYVTGELRLDCDIQQPTTEIGSAAGIHQLVLVATGDIAISPSVRQIDAWVISKGKIDTCVGIAVTALRDNVCNTQLRINGPVMARTVELKRTYTDQTRDRAAEEFNLRGDAYIWAHTISRNNATWQTTYTTDLPPRY